ncbi:hypothetical protein [uncultured Rummeliibacillus sp.]|uniref:hypothetical protein n=1 Tax=uncultured Rummeliibacillus sp. TaxID=762292 RepID=UPI0026259093|nr:hypothetical protein [uncultured Rummeliibacillus sp.]
MELKTPWYLKEKTLYFFCFVSPPIGYLVLFLNLKKFKHTQKIEYLTVATVMMSIWLLKFLPEKLNNYIWAIIITLLVGNAIIKFLKNKNYK